MSPLQLEILLHYYYSAEDFPRLGKGVVSEEIQSFIKEEMLVPTKGDGRSYKLGERGEVFVAALCALPLPVRDWRMP